MPQELPRLLTRREMCELLRITDRTLFTWDTNGSIGPRKMTLGSDEVRWDGAEMEAWIDAGCPKRPVWEPRWQLIVRVRKTEHAKRSRETHKALETNP